MFDVTRSGWRDFTLRLAGLAVFACGYLALRWLFHDANLRATRDASALDCLAAASGFLCLSTGSALTMLGTHILDQVEISQRWARKSHASADAGQSRGVKRTPD